jgi:hypothetical protein
LFQIRVRQDWKRFAGSPGCRTLLDAGRFIETLPKANHERPEWLTATRLLPVTAEGRGSVMFAQIALIKANLAKPIRRGDRRH